MWTGPFTVNSNTINIAVSSSASASVALPGRGEVLRVVNEGTAIAYISVGQGAQVATLPTTTAKNTSTPVLPGSDSTYSVPDVPGLQISAITATGTTVLDIQVGMGI